MHGHIWGKIQNEKGKEAKEAGEKFLAENIWASNAGKVEKILNMSQWEKTKFTGLLTSTIWKSNAGEVEKSILVHSLTKHTCNNPLFGRNYFLL